MEVGKRPRSVAFTPDGKRAYVDLRGRRHRLGDRRGRPEEAQGHHDARGLQADGRGGRARREADLRLQRPGRDRVGHRSGHRLDRRQRQGRHSGPGASRSHPTAGSSTPPTGPSNDVSVVDAAGLKVTKTVPVGKLPWGVAIGPGAVSPAACRWRCWPLLASGRRAGGPDAFTIDPAAQARAARALERQRRRQGRAGGLPGERHRGRHRPHLSECCRSTPAPTRSGGLGTGLARDLRPARLAGHGAHPHRAGRRTAALPRCSRAPTAASC